MEDKSEEVVMAAVEEAVNQASANFIYDKEKFPDGFQTLIGERGLKLSGG